MDQVFIQHRFTLSDSYGVFSDAIVLPKAEYDLLSAKNITDTKAARLLGWKKAIDDAKLLPSPTKAEQLSKVTSELTELTKKVDDLTLQKQQLEAGK